MCIVIVVAIAVGIGAPACAGTNGNNSVATAADQGTYTVMHFTKDQLDEMQSEINAEPKYSAPAGLVGGTQSLPLSEVSLLSYLPYIPSQRDQGHCGNCWVWASTGALEIEHNINNGISDRLSIQYVNSKYEYDTGNYACLGGDLDTFKQWYNTDKSPIPWTNTNASYGDYTPHADGSTAVPFSSISTSPSYTLNSLSDSTISTFEVGNSTAITNIEAALDSKRPVWYGFYLPYSGWTNIETFWGSGSNASMFDPSLYNGQSLDGGHAVIIVGYDTMDPSNPYWLVVNSWGAPSNRPDGLFRLNMSMNYDARVYDSGTVYQQNLFQILNSEFTGNAAAPTVSSVSPGSGPIAGGTPVTITGIGFTGATNVTFGSTAATSFTASTAANDSQIIAITPAGTAGTVDITVTTPYGISPTSTVDQYTYTAAPPMSGGSDAADSGRGSSYGATSPGAPAGQAMTFALNQPITANAPGAFITVAVVPSTTLGSTEITMADANTIDKTQLTGRQTAYIASIQPVGVNPASISQGTITFAVAGSWLSQHGVNPQDIVLMRDHDGHWSELTTSFDHQAGNTYYFTATTPGFSYFAITTRVNAMTGNTTTVTATPTVTVITNAVTPLAPTTVPTYSRSATTPVTTQTTAVPASDAGPAGSTGIPVLAVITGIVGIVIVTVGGVLVRRWWIRRQNPALFRKYD